MSRSANTAAPTSSSEALFIGAGIIGSPSNEH